MFDIIYRKFMELPSWSRWFTIFILFSMIGGLEQAWGKRKFVAEFAEATFANILYWGSLGLSFFIAFKCFQILEIKYNNRILSWVGAIILFFSIGGLSGLLISQIPGVGWRYEKMLS
jgi:hypothetical protein